MFADKTLACVCVGCYVRKDIRIRYDINILCRVKLVHGLSGQIFYYISIILNGKFNLISIFDAFFLKIIFKYKDKSFHF